MKVPLFKLDSGERWLPCAVEVATQVGAKIDNGQPFTNLDQLTADVKRIDFPANMTQPKTDSVVYHRAVLDSDLWWHQFWTFWLYNPKEYVGFGAHEGDWEMVQLGCIDQAGDHPIVASYSQHSAGEKRFYWQGIEQADVDGPPLVYVAIGSHANYFTIHHDLQDDANGKRSIIPQVREFGQWASWPGYWGNSDNSPRSPAMHRSWQQPANWHAAARG